MVSLSGLFTAGGEWEVTVRMMQRKRKRNKKGLIFFLPSVEGRPTEALFLYEFEEYVIAFAGHAQQLAVGCRECGVMDWLEGVMEAL